MTNAQIIAVLKNAIQQIEFEAGGNPQELATVNHLGGHIETLSAIPEFVPPKAQIFRESVKTNKLPGHAASARSGKSDPAK
jgi:hypothetical protein